MKLLFDENLSRRLVERVSDLFPGSSHVCHCGLQQAGDAEVWQHARDGGFVLVSADGDSYEMALTKGPPPKVIWLRGCDYPTSVAERLLRDQAVRISEFSQDEAQAVLILVP